MVRNEWVSERLRHANGLVFTVFAVAAAFSTYFCMYAFRKPFAAGTYEGSIDLPWVGLIEYKTLFIITQVLGYCLSKFLGIKVISEMTPARRAAGILLVIGVAWFALLGFALTPAPYNAIFLFINGLPLGMVWGLVFGFLEGRRLTEVLGAGLSVSYIIASGYVKAVGKWLVTSAGVSEYWMPFVTGAFFVLPMVFFVWMLAQLPPPDAEDEALRMRREPMDAAQRKAFFLRFLPGLLPLTVLYVLLTAYRDFRDNFAVEIWAALGYADEPAILATSENWVALGVLLTLAVLFKIRDNRVALTVVHLLMLLGTCLIGLSTWLWEAGMLEPSWWMISVGLGLYMAYVPYGCVLFDRLFAAVGVVGTAGFLIYVTDAFGYLGSVLLLLYKDLGQPDLSWIEFFTGFSYLTSLVCGVCFAISTVYFAQVTTAERQDARVV